MSVKTLTERAVQLHKIEKAIDKINTYIANIDCESTANYWEIWQGLADTNKFLHTQRLQCRDAIIQHALEEFGND